MENALAVRQPSGIVRTMDDAERAAVAMAKSGFFTDSRDAAQALVKILAGQELGFGPFASMNGVYIIQGRPSLSANLIASSVKKSGRYDYRVIENTEKTCSIKFLQNGEEIGVSTFTFEDAKKAGTKNLDKFPRNMLFARAMSNGARWYCPDVFNGNTVYTPEELGANVNEDGQVIDIQPAPTQPPAEVKTEPPAPQWNEKALTEIATERNTTVDKLKRALVFSADFGGNNSKEVYTTWLDYYAEARKREGAEKMTPQEAGEYADLETMKIYNLGAIV